MRRGGNEFLNSYGRCDGNVRFRGSHLIASPEGPLMTIADIVSSHGYLFQ
jgi:hypothetical protein